MARANWTNFKLDRPRSRSATSNSSRIRSQNAGSAQYSPEQHPTTDPSLLALSQQQVYDGPVSIDSKILEQSAASTPYPIDPALGPSPAESDSRALTTTPPIEVPNFDHGQGMETSDREESAFAEDDLPGTTSGRNSKRSSTVGPPLSVPEDNDAELRRLAQENASVDLNELAKRVRNDENTPAAEKTRQVYGLGWYVYVPLLCTC